MTFDEEENKNAKLYKDYLEIAKSEMEEMKSNREKFANYKPQTLIHLDFYLPVETVIKVMELLKENA